MCVYLGAPVILLCIKSPSPSLDLHRLPLICDIAAMLRSAATLLISAYVVGQVSAQTFQRLGGCPKLGCVFPPDQTDFLVGQFFDIRLEVHAPVNGSQAAHAGVPDEKFTFCIQSGGNCKNAASFFSVKEPTLEKWTFSCVSAMSHAWSSLTLNLSSRYFEDLFAQDAQTPTTVNVASKAYRGVSRTRFSAWNSMLIL